MNSDKRNIDKIIKVKIENHEMIPDDALWESIEASIIYKNKSRGIYKGLIIAAVCITLIVLFYTFRNTEKASSDTAPETDPVKQQMHYSPAGETIPQTDIKESQSESSYISKDVLINHSTINDSLQTGITISNDSLIPHAKEMVVSTDTSAFISTPIKNIVTKKVIKKPLYVIQQDTIYKIDTLKRRKIK